MKYFLRPYRSLSCLIALAGVAAWQFAAPNSATAQAQLLSPVFVGSSAQAATAQAQGYLGVDIADVDAAHAQVLKLKDTHGAIITLIDHDAPAGQIGLKVNDVVLEFNGQSISTADQLRRMLKEIPAGRKVALEISRDGELQNFTVELVDRREIEKNVWNQIGSSNNEAPRMGILSGDTMPSGFRFPSFGSTLKVGALVEPLTMQMAAHLGVQSGLMVKQVAHKSEAEAAGLRAFDVILKVGPEAISTSADWDRALRSNQGKPVQLTILRDKKQQTLTLQVGSKRHQKGELEERNLFPGDAELIARMDAEIGQDLAEQIQEQAEEAALSAAAQVQALRECMNDFQVNPQHMQQLQRRMDELQKNLNPDQFKIDTKQMDEFRHQMHEFQQQLKDWTARSQGRFV